MTPALPAETAERRKTQNRTKRNAERTAAGKCYRCNLRPPTRGRRCEECAKRDGASPRGARAAAKPVIEVAALVKLRLRRDDREGMIARRDATCARLLACEDEWIAVYVGANVQARCPRRCKERVARI